MSRTTFLQALLGLLAACACRSAPPTDAETEAALRQGARTVVDEEGFTLFSPYDAASTADYAAVVRAEVRGLRVLFTDATAATVRIYLVPIPSDAPEATLGLPITRDSTAGGAYADFLAVYSPASTHEGSLAMQAEISRGVLRHELVHVYSRRAGLDGPTWFREGVALEIGDMRGPPGALVARVFPRELVAARRTAGPGALAKLLHWKLHEEPSVGERARLYDLARAWMRFLVARDVDRRGVPTEAFTAAEVVACAARIRAADETDLLVLEPEWLDWLAELDAVATIRERSIHGTAYERLDAVLQLSVLAEAGAEELATRAADELALALLDEPDVADAAFQFLRFFRAKALRPADIGGLTDSDAPALCVFGQALRAARGEPVDVASAIAAFDRLPAQQRSSLYSVTILIPELAGR